MFNIERKFVNRSIQSTHPQRSIQRKDDGLQRVPTVLDTMEDDYGKKDKKLVYLARTVYDQVRKGEKTNGTRITN